MNTETQVAKALHSPTVTPVSTPQPGPSATGTSSPTPVTPTLTPPASTATATLTPQEVASCLTMNTQPERGTVTQVIDGDTVTVRLADGQEHSLRYIGIDSPERGHMYFEEALKANADIVLDREVILIKDVSDVDQEGRLLRYVVAGNVFINQQMLRSGYASAYRYPPDVACAELFASVEAEARRAQVGIWIATPTAQALEAQVIIVEVNKVAEWVDIQNTGANNVDLQGWRLVSERGDQECNLQGMLRAGETLRIWAMAAQGAGYSCGFTSNIWNNSQPDPAVLYNPQGVEVSRK